MKDFFILYDCQIFSIQRFGGISRYFCEIIKHLDYKTKIAIRFTMNYYLNPWRFNYLLPIPRFIFKHYRSYFEKKNRNLIKRMLNQKNRYLFHPTYYDPYFLKYIGENPYIITVHDMIHEKFPNCFSDAKIVIKQKEEVIKKASRIIAISKNTKKDIIEILGINPEKIDIIYHGTDMKPHTSKYKLNLPKRFILFVGDRTFYKNFELFTEAFASLYEKDRNIFVVCTGQRLLESEKKKLSELGILEQFIHIRATDKELSELYSRALLFVYPSLYEGFGIPLLEAFACHCPIALSNTSCFPEIAGEAGIYFDPYSKASIVEALKEGIYNKSKREQIVNKGNERLKLFSWKKAAKQTEETYMKAYNEYNKC